MKEIILHQNSKGHQILIIKIDIYYDIKVQATLWSMQMKEQTILLQIDIINLRSISDLKILMKYLVFTSDIVYNFYFFSFVNSLLYILEKWT